MRRRRNNTNNTPNIINDDAASRGMRVRVTEIHYESPQASASTINENLYTESFWRILVACLVITGAVGKYLSTSSSASINFTPSLIDLPFCLTTFLSGMSLVYWILLPYPAHLMWPDPLLPFEEFFIVKGQYHNIKTSLRHFGVFLLSLGITGMLCSAFYLGTSWSPMSKPTWSENEGVNGEGLVITGPYAYIRHPMYLCNFMIAIGLGCVSGNYVVGCSWILLALSLSLRIVSEEQDMANIFAESNNAERNDIFHQWMNTTGMLLPKLW